MSRQTGRFQRADRISCAREFSRVVKAGRRLASRGFVVLIAQRSDETARASEGQRRKLGITVSKRVGNAVVRNRLKRCIREWFRAARGTLPVGSDTVVIARHAARDFSGREVKAALDELVDRLGSSHCDVSRVEVR